MPLITVFEHQKVYYDDLCWSLDHPYLEQLNRLNQSASTILIRLGQHALQANQFVGILRRHDYPPVKQEKAMMKVLEQAEGLSEEWV